MDMTLKQMADRAIGMLQQTVTVRPQTGTFVSLGAADGDGVKPITINVLRQGAFKNTGLVEIGYELLEVYDFDTTTGVGSVPPWGRAQLGTTEYTASAGDKVTISPQWPYWTVASAVIDGMAALFPSLFQVKNTTLTSAVNQEQYQLPADCYQIQSIREVGFGAPEHQFPITRYTVDTEMADGNRYLYIPTRSWSGRDIHVTYRARPTLPADPTELSTLFSASGLPTTAADLPILHAVATLVPQAEVAKTQNASAEQSDRNRYVQTGTATAASRRFMDMFNARLDEERRALHNLNPPAKHHLFIGRG